MLPHLTEARTSSDPSRGRATAAGLIGTVPMGFCECRIKNVALARASGSSAMLRICHHRAGASLRGSGQL